MNNTEKVSNTFFVHGFIIVSLLILTVGAVFTLSLIKIFGNIVSTGSTSHSPVIIGIGVGCLALLPYCFRIFKSLQILEIMGPNLLLHPPIFVNDINYPSEIELKQITDISRDKIFNALVKITFEEDGQEQHIYTFIKKGKLALIQK